MVIAPQPRCALLAQERYIKFPKEGITENYFNWSNVDATYAKVFLSTGNLIHKFEL